METLESLNEKIKAYKDTIAIYTGFLEKVEKQLKELSQKLCQLKWTDDIPQNLIGLMVSMNKSRLEDKDIEDYFEVGVHFYKKTVKLDGYFTLDEIRLIEEYMSIKNKGKNNGNGS